MKCVKEFNLNKELDKYKYQCKSMTDRQLKLKMYGLIGEERVNYELIHIEKNLIMLYNVRLKINNDAFQADFILIGNNKVILLEVKNLMDNIHITKNGSVERIIHRKDRDEICGMYNPIMQMNKQIKKLETYFLNNNISVEIKGYVVMANEKSIIINDSEINNVIMYYELKRIINEEFNNEEPSNKSYEISELLCKDNDEYDFSKYNFIQNNMLYHTYTPKKLNHNDYILYCKVLEIRNEIHKNNNIPTHYIFNNRDAERLVLAKPCSKEEFIKVPGFKEKRYQLFGKEIINIFKNNQ